MAQIKVVILTGSQTRHRYYANFLSERLDVVGVITEPHLEYFDEQRKESNVVKNHFSNMKKYEEQYLGEYGLYPNCRLLQVKPTEINNIETIEWVKNLNPDYILLYGTGILNNVWCDSFDTKIINLHLGLSPTYRGAATLFWTFYNDDLDNLGTTIHLASNDVDGGDILKTVGIDITNGDNYYDITNKLFIKSVKNIPGVLEAYHNSQLIPLKQDKSNQKYYYKKNDFNEKSLIKVLEKYYG